MADTIDLTTELNERYDSFSNVVLGYANKHDPESYRKIMGGTFVNEQDLRSLYLTNGLAQLIVEKLPQEMTRAGFIIENVDEKINTKILAEIEDMSIMNAFYEAMCWSRLLGGSCIVIGAIDGGMLADPLNESSVKSIDFLRVYDRYEMQEFRKYQDPGEPKYGKTEIWMITPANNAQPYLVHETRMLVWAGMPIPNRERQQNLGWGVSCLQRVIDTLSRVYGSHKSAKNVLDRMQQAVHKMKDLASILKQKGGELEVAKRLAAADLGRSVMGTVTVDLNEDFQIFSQTLSGVKDTLQEFVSLLSAETGYPIFILGRQIGGMNSTGQREIEAWHNQIASEQNKDLRKPLEYLIQLMLNVHGSSNPDWTIIFNPLNALNDKEDAEVKKYKAETKKIVIETYNNAVNHGFVTSEQLITHLEDVLEIDNLKLGEKVEPPLPGMPGIPKPKDEEKDKQQSPVDKEKETD